MARTDPHPPQRPPLLATTTNEPFQPVRLTFAVPDAGAVRAKLKRIACGQEVPAMDCWECLFAKEAAALRFPGTDQDVPLVEDLPLYPEEETPDFREFGTVLALRAARAMVRARRGTINYK